MTRVALPTGDLRVPVRDLLADCGVEMPGYEPESRIYRPRDLDDGLTFRVFREKDIPIQIALGNYDLGICSLVWWQELHARYPQDNVVVLGALDLPAPSLRVACAAEGAAAQEGPVTIATEFPHLAEDLAMRLRLPAFRILQVWGGPEAYPPEDATLVLLAGGDSEGLHTLAVVEEGRVAVLANRDALARGACAGFVAKLPLHPVHSPVSFPRVLPLPAGKPPAARGLVRLAVPDGHQQRHAFASLQDAGLAFEGYEEKRHVRRPASGIEGLEVKVIRPQDMAQMVAIGSFDLAITGRDWLADHLSRFPESPVEMAVDLGRSPYGLAAVVDSRFPADSLEEAIPIWQRLGRPLRIASEYLALADAFGRRYHLGDYRVLPIAGASEGFVPEDADVLIEGSETGGTIRANDLKILAWIFQSTNCLIRGRRPLSPEAQALADRIVERMQQRATAAAAG